MTILFRILSGLAFFCFSLIVLPHSAQTALQDASMVWQEMEPGLELACFSVQASEGREGTLRVLRIDPSQHTLVILSAAVQGEKVRSLRDWAGSHNLSAAINAGMYQPDGRTHTGYLRVGNTLNNPHIAARFGAFFVAGPDLADQLPAAAVLDRSASDWEELIPHYDMVVQNFRMIDASRRIQWLADGPAHAISAVGEDGSGRILFLHCGEPMTCAEFSRQLLELPLDIRQVMYTEGGSQAGLYLDTGREIHVWAGRHPSGFWPAGGINAPLPNVIGVKKGQ